MNIRPVIETTFHHHFASKGVDRTTTHFSKVMESVVLTCEREVERRGIRDTSEIIDVIEEAVKGAEKELCLQ